MAAVAVHQFAQCITCHAWSPDHSMVAFCPNTSEVHIYGLMQDKWEKFYVLQKLTRSIHSITGVVRAPSVTSDALSELMDRNCGHFSCNSEKISETSPLSSFLELVVDHHRSTPSESQALKSREI